MCNQSTNLRRFLRKLRITHNENLFEMTKRIDTEVTLLSKAEDGKIEVPPYVIDRIERVYNLSENERIDLRQAVEHDKKLFNSVAVDFDNTNNAAYTMSPNPNRKY